MRKHEVRDAAWDIFQSRHPRLSEWTLYRRFWETVAEIVGRRAAWGNYTALEWRRALRGLRRAVR